jgi:hypothetical protein
MPLVSTSIPNLLNGVSQQPSSLRQLTQGETQTNALSSVIDGLIKRPSTEHIAKILSSSVDNAAIHIIDRGVDNRHITVVTATASSATVYIFKIDGTTLTTNVVSSADQYLYTDNPQRDLKFLTIADTTFILNKTKTVAMKTAVTPGTLYAVKYQSFSDLPTNRETHYTGDGSQTRFAIGFQYGNSSNVEVRVDSSVVSFGFESGDVSRVKLYSAPASGASVVVFERPQAGVYYEVVGDENSSFDNYYVKSLSGTSYEETVKPGITYQLDETTLPVKLVPNSSTNPTSFSLEHSTWEDRTVGDTESAPNPSFVGLKLNDIFFFKNRLGFLAEDKIIMSASGDFFRFFPDTVTTLLAGDPIDVAVSHTKISLLNHAIAFNESLTLFSDQTQFTISTAGNLTPQNIAIVPSTEFENEVNVSPVGAGNSLYFVTQKGNFSSIREYFIASDTVITDALEITAHVPKYIPNNVVKLTTSSNEDTLVALSHDANNRWKLFIYKWFTDGRQKLQSSWSTWDFSNNQYVTSSNSANEGILDVQIIDNDLYMIVNNSDGVYLEKLPLQYPNDSLLNFHIRLDRKAVVNGFGGALYDSINDYTTWTLPYSIDTATEVKVIKQENFGDRIGTDITTTRPSPTTVRALGNHDQIQNSDGSYTQRNVVVGVPYDMTYEFSTQHVREKGGAQSVQSGRLQLRTMRINYEDTGYFKVQVTPEARQTYEYEFTGVVLNQSGSTIEDVILSDGTFRFPVQAKNDQVSIKLTSDSYLPVRIQNAEWEGHYTIRSQRI